jgi:NAD(P)-dependent dehydrogenase (short-subunit alcohol dehydrogenase family)
VEATRRWSGDGIAANAVLPGAILDTNLTRHMPPEQLEAVVKSRPYKLKTIEQGAATSVLVATWPQLEGIGGRTFDDCNESPVVDPATASEPLMAGVATYAVDAENASRLWNESLELIGARPAPGGRAKWN